jgi:undecaprenyl-diphosphatase
MLEFFYSLDVQVFYFLNHTISNRFLDRLFPFLTDVKNWYIAYIVLLGIAFVKGGRLGKIAVFFMLILITVSDQLSSFVLKDLFARVRPCNALPDVNILVGCTSSYSFPSSHAVNNFAAAMFFGKLFPKTKWVLFIGASIMALTRPYVGVHYPSDILGGALIGIAIGWIFAFIVQKLDGIFKGQKLFKPKRFVRVKPDDMN